MAENPDRKGISDAKKTFKAVTASSATPAVPAAPVRGRPRKAARPEELANDVPASAPAVDAASESIRIPFVADPVSDSPAAETPAEAAPLAETAAPVAPAPAAEPEPTPLPAPAEAGVPDLDTAPAVAETAAGAEAQVIPAPADKTEQKPPAAYAFAGLFTPFMTEDKMMDMNPNFSGFQEAMNEAQAKAKAAFEKSTSMLGEVSDFTKGNVEAVMESGKIFAEGIQGIGSELVTEGRSAFETMTGDIKELAAAKSPTDFFKIQGEMMRKNFDSAVAYGSKNSEAMLKLMSDAIAPISGRVSVAMEKARSASV